MQRVLALVAVLLIAGVASAAPELVYTPDGDNTIVTAQEAGGGAQYWQMEVRTASDNAKAGAIWGFYDLSGASDPGFNYVHRYSHDAGLMQTLGAVDDALYQGAVETFSGLTQNASSMTYVIGTTEARDGGTATFTSAVTISAPTATAAGYNTSISIVETMTFDENWVSGDGQVGKKDTLAAPTFWLHASDATGAGNEWSASTSEGDTYQIVEATVTGDDPDMAAGSIFQLTNSWDEGEGGNTTYDGVSTEYEGHGSAYFELKASKGLSDLSFARAAPGQTYTSQTDFDISIVPEPATMGLLGLGLAGMAVARRKRK